MAKRQLSEDQIRYEARRLKMKVAGKKDAVVRKMISKEWLAHLRSKLSKQYQDVNYVNDADLESFYNLHTLIS